VPDPDYGDGPQEASKARLRGVLEDLGVKSLKYLYDFGDGWEHTVCIERVVDAVPGIIYPQLIEAVGRCPPEDVGGLPGYQEFLEAIADPDHEEHDRNVTWVGGHFDPLVVDFDRLNRAVAALAKRWTHSPARGRNTAS
jgi:hypothetical protein